MRQLTSGGGMTSSGLSARRRDRVRLSHGNCQCPATIRRPAAFTTWTPAAMFAPFRPTRRRSPAGGATVECSTPVGLRRPRPQKFHSLWTMNRRQRPDAPVQQHRLSGRQVFVMIDALPIPGSDNVVAVFSPGHGFRERRARDDPQSHAGRTIGLQSGRSAPVTAGIWAWGADAMTSGPVPAQRRMFSCRRRQSLSVSIAAGSSLPADG